MDYYESMKDDYDLIDHIVAFLKAYYNAKMRGQKSEVESRTARIFATFLQNQIGSLKDYAKQIDDEYEE